MDPLTLTAIMAGTGILKNELIDKPQSRKLNKAEAAKTYYSPWTGMKGQTVAAPSSIDAGMKYGLTGAMMGQQMGMNNPAPGTNQPGIAMNYQPQMQQQNPWQNMLGGYTTAPTAMG